MRSGGRSPRTSSSAASCAGQALARPELAYSVHVEVGGLGSGRHYWYRFFVEGISSDIGTVRTAPAPGERAEQLRIAVGGCQNFQAGLFTTWRHVANEPDLDLVYHYGDYIYESKPAGSTGTRSDRPPWFGSTRAVKPTASMTTAVATRSTNPIQI